MTRSQLRSGRDENWKLINEKKKLKQKTSNHKKFEKKRPESVKAIRCCKVRAVYGGQNL